MRFLVILPAYFKRTLLRDNRADIWMNDGHFDAPRLLTRRTLLIPDRTGHFPSAKAIQELVQAWKQLRKWRSLSAAGGVGMISECCCPAPTIFE
jgi:hypothetical protein